MCCPMQTAVRLCLPGELAKHAVSEGTKARIECHCLCTMRLTPPMACHSASHQVAMRQEVCSSPKSQCVCQGVSDCGPLQAVTKFTAK